MVSNLTYDNHLSQVCAHSIYIVLHYKNGQFFQKIVNNQ